MPNTVIQLKKSGVVSARPSDLANGELAINFADGKLFYKNTTGHIAEFSSGSNSFGTVNANGTLVVSDTTGDVLSLVSGNNITIVGDAVNDIITVGLSNDITLPGVLYLKEIGGDEGGQIELANAITNSSLSGNVVIDIYQNRLRFYEKNSPNKGAFIDLSIAGSGVSSNLLASGSSSSSAGINIANQTTSSSTFYPILTTNTSGSISAANVSSTKLSFVPSTGTLSATVFNSTSDANFKKNISTIKNGLSIINSLRGVSFDWKDTEKPSYGLIAQEVEQHLPELVATDENGNKSMNYDAVIGFLVEAVKELSSKIDG